MSDDFNKKGSDGFFQDILRSFLGYVEELAGDDSNIRVKVESLKLNLDSNKITIDGDVNIDLVDEE